MISLFRLLSSVFLAALLISCVSPGKQPTEESGFESQGKFPAWRLDNPFEHGHYVKEVMIHDLGQKLHRVGKEISYIINREDTYKSHMYPKINWVTDDDILPYEKILNSEVVSNMYKENFKMYYKKCTWRLRRPGNIPSIRGRFDEFLVNFFEENSNIL